MCHSVHMLHEFVALSWTHVYTYFSDYVIWIHSPPAPFKVVIVMHRLSKIIERVMPSNVAGNSTYLSPASSITSLNGPDLPSRPTSPWISDFYDSEVEVDRDRFSKSPRNTIDRNRNSRQQAKNGPTGTSSTSKQDPKANYMYYRSQNILDNGVPYVWPSTNASTLSNTAAANQRRDSAPRDLFDLARQRRQSDHDPLGLVGLSAGQDTDWRARSQSLPRMRTTNNIGDRTLQMTSPNLLSVTSSQPVKTQQQQRQQQQRQQQQPCRKESASPTPKYER